MQNYVERELVLGEFEREFIEYFESLFENKHYHFADVGANVGFYSILCSNVSSSSRIDAFEPLPENVRRLRRNIDINNVEDINIFEFALSDTKGHTTIDTPEENPAEASTMSAGGIGIRRKKMDDVYPDTPPDVIKIDIEGAEIALLEGGRETLSDHHPLLLIEVHPQLYNGEYRKDLSNILQKLGYADVHIIEENEYSTVAELARCDLGPTTHIAVSAEDTPV